MQVSSATMLNILLFVVIAYQAYSAYDIRDKILCTFRRSDRTKITKWAKNSQSRIEFDGGWYDVEPERVTLSLKWNPLPMWVRTLDYRHDSARALHPDTFDNKYTPEQRKQLDKSDDIRAMHQGNVSTFAGMAGKQGLLQQYFPIIVLFGFLAIGWLTYRAQGQIDKVGFATNVVQQQNVKLTEQLTKVTDTLNKLTAGK